MNTTVRFNHHTVGVVTTPAKRMVTPMQRLKAATNAQHILLEQTVDLLQLSSSLPAYHALLQRFYGFYAPLEAQLATLPWSTVNFDVRPRRKSTLLAADLYWLGESPASLATLARCTALPPVVDIPQALGYLYVSEGSTLGGQVIIRQLQQKLPITPATGGQFFNSYGPAVGPMWQQLSHFINTFIPSTERSSTENAGTERFDAEKRMLQTAYLTFQALHHWLAAGTMPATIR